MGIGKQISRAFRVETSGRVLRKLMVLCMVTLYPTYCKVSSACIDVDPSCNAAAAGLLFDFHIAHNNAGVLQWTRLLGVAGVQTEARAVTTDAAGNAYVTGFTDGNLDGGTLAGIRDLFLTKYDRKGARIWTRLLGVAAADSWGFGVRVDHSGNIFLTGGTAGNLDGQIKSGTYDLHLIKYDSNGNRQWTRLLGVAAVLSESFSLTLDQASNAYISGYTDGNLDGQIRTGTRDLFVIKYDSNGNKQWTRLLGVAAAQTRSYAIAPDAEGNLYVTGSTSGALDGQSFAGTLDLFLVRFDLNGTRTWTRLLGVPGVTTDARAVVTDGGGSVYLTGFTDGGLGGETLTGTRDLFLAKYDRSGARIWTRLLGVPAVVTWGFGVTTDVLGNLYVTGGTAGNLDQQTKTGTWDMHVVKYDGNGTRQWTRLLGAPAVKAEGYGTEITTDGTLYNVGYTEGNLGAEIQTGTRDLFLNQYR
ncbi:MAG: SBBP repeat-containing protein [Spirochaetia bacterium]|nr:SBBP repeat-containing protein [Spirochaetia bacterium]